MYSDDEDVILVDNRSIRDIITKQNKDINKIIYVEPYKVIELSSDDECLMGGYKNKIPKTFIDKLKKNPYYKTNFKNYTLEEVKPETKEIIMATIIDYNFLKRITNNDSLKNKDILDYFCKDMEYIPLIFGDTNHKNIIYMKKISEKKKKTFMRKKKHVFNTNDRPIVIFFKVSSNLKFYKTVKKETVDDKITEIKENAVMEYIIGRYFFLIPNPEKNLKIMSIESIEFDNENFILTPFKDQNDINFDKMLIEDFENIFGEVATRCTKFN